MAGAASASSPGHGGLSIPKIKKRTFKDCIQHVSVNNRDVQNLLQDVSKNCLDVNFMKKIDILQVSMVHSAKLQAQYVQKKTEMKESGRSPQSLVDQLGFRMTNHVEKHKIAKEGLCAKDKDSRLGRGDCGVCLTRYFDVEVNYVLQGYPTVEIFVFKYFAGKCKPMNVGNFCDKINSSIEPTPNFDSHVGSSLPNLNERPYIQVCKSIIYLYEYTDECVPSKYPRHCLPFAVIKVKKRSEAVRPVIVPRVIPSAVAACGEPPWDKPPSSPPADASRVNASSKASSTKTQASLLSKTGSPLQSLAECDAKGPVNISNRRDSSNSNIIVIIGETQDARSKENAATVKMDGVKKRHEHKPIEALGSMSQKDRKANLAGGGSKASQNETLSLLIESQTQYLKRLDAAKEKLCAEKNSKMSECLQFLPSPEPQESASLNGSSASSMTKTSLVGPPRTDNSKCTSFVVPDSHNSVPRTDRFGGNTNMFNRHIPHTASGHHSTNSVKESVSTDSAARNHLSYTGHTAGRTPLFRNASARNIDATSQVWNQNVDPRLLKRGQSTSDSSSSNVPPSHNPANRSATVRFPIKSALKKVDSQNVVKTKISLSEYKKLKAQQQSDSVPSVLVSNDAVVHNKSTAGSSSIAVRTKANSTKDCSSQNSVTTQQSQNVQTQQLQCHTAKIENKLPNSSVSTAGSAPTYSSVPGSDVLPQDSTKAATLQTPGKTSNIFHSFVGANFQLTDPLLAVPPKPNSTSFNLDARKKLMSNIDKVSGNMFQKTTMPVKDSATGNVQKTTMPVKDSATGNVQKEQLKEYEICGLSNQPKVVPDLQTKHIDTISDSVEEQLTEVTPALNLTPCSDNDADGNNRRMIVQAEVNKQADKHHFQYESLGESTSAPKFLTDLQTSSINQGIHTKPDLITSDMEVTSDVEDTNKLATSHFAPIHSAAIGMNKHTVMAPTPLRHDQEMESYSEDSPSSEDEYDSYVEASTSDLDFLSQGGFRKFERKLYGNKPLPKSISMRDVGIECYLLALGDSNYQPLAIVVDYIEARCKKACKVCEASRQHFPRKYLTSVNVVTEMEKQTCVAAALPSGNTSEEQSGGDNSFEVSSPDASSEVMAGVNSVAAALHDITLEEQFSKDNSFEMSSPDGSREAMAGVNSVAAALHDITLEEQLDVENTLKVSSLETSRKALSGEDSIAAALSGGITLDEQLSDEDSCEMSSPDTPRAALPKDDSISAALPGITLEMQLGVGNSCKMSNLVALPGKVSVPLPRNENYSSVNSNQPSETGQNACSKPDIVATTDTFRTKPSRREAAASLVSPLDTSCTKSLSKREPCSTDTRETNTLSLLTSQSNSASTVTLTETHVIRNYVPIPALTAYNDVPELSEKSTNKMVAYSDTDTSSSDDEELDVTKASQENSASSKFNGSSNTEAHTPKEKPSGGWELEDSKSDEAFREHLLEETYVKGLLERNVKQSNLRNQNESHSNAVPHTPMKEPAAGLEPEDSRSDETFREHLLEETYKKGLLQKQIIGQKVLMDASNRMRPTPTLNEKDSRVEVIEVKDSSSDEEILQGNLMTTCKAKRSFERKGLVSQQVVKDTSNIKIEAVAIMDVSSDGNEHQGVIDSVKCRAGDVPATRSRSPPCEHKQREACDQSVNERNHSALSNTSAESGNDLSLPLSVPDKMTPEKEILAKIPFCQTLSDITSSQFAPTSVISNLNCTQKVLPENYVAQKVQPVTKENALDSQLAPHFSMGEKEKGSIGAEAPVSAIAKVDKMKQVDKNSAAKHVQVQKGVVTSYDSMTESSSEKSPNHRALNKYNHIKTDNSSSRVKLFLDKVRENAEVKKHIDKEVLAFQKLINCDETKGNSESTIHKPVAFHDKNQKLLSNVSGSSCTKESNEILPSCKKVLTTISTNSEEHPVSQIANKTCTDQNNIASISEADKQDGSLLCSGSITSAFANLQENTESSTVLSTPAEVWKNPLMTTNRIETIITNNSHTNVTSSHVDNPVVDDREGSSLCQIGTDYRVQAYFTTADVDERNILQQSFGGGDLRTQMLPSIPVVQQNFAIPNQVHTTADVDERRILQQSFGGGDLQTHSLTSIPVVQQNFAISNQVHYYTNYFPQGSRLWNQGVRNASSQMPVRHPYTHTHPGFPRQTWTRPQNVHVTAPIVDFGNTFMADQDYRHMRPEYQMSTSRNAVMINCHKPPERDVYAAAATMPLQHSLPARDVCAAATMPLPAASGQHSLPARDVCAAAATMPFPAAGGQHSLPVRDVHAAAATMPLHAAGGQHSLPASHYTAFSNYTETMNLQKWSSGNSSNQCSSSFWLSRDQSSTNISGLGFDPSGTKVSDIPGLGDVTQIHDDGERHLHFPPEAEAIASSSEGVNKTSFDAKTIYPEIYNSCNSSNESIKERCRSILKSVNSSSQKVDTAVKSIKINDEDYSDDEQTNSPLPATHDKEHSGCVSETLEHAANVPQNAEVPFRETSPDHEKEENSKLSKLLYAHLSNVISKVSSAPKVESKDPLPVLELLRKTLEKTHKHLLEEASDDTESSHSEDAEHDIDTCPRPERSNSRELDQDKMFDSCRIIEETLSPTKGLQNTILLNTKCQSPKIEFTEVYNSDVCLRQDIAAPLTSQSGTSPMKSVNSAGNSSSNIKRSESRSVNIEDTKNISSVSETKPNSTPTRARSSSPTNSKVSKEVDLPLKRPSELPLKSSEDDTPLELNTVTRVTDEIVGNPTVSSVSVDTKNTSRCPPLCKDTEMPTVCGKDVTEVSVQALQVKETAPVVHCLPDTRNVDTRAPINTTISVSSNGKIYLSDVPLDALSYAREKILSEINRLGDAEVASPPETPTCELTSVDADETVRASGGSPVNDFEEGEISSDSECVQLDTKIVPEQKSKLTCENKRLKRKKSHADKGDSKNERKKIVKRDSVRNEKLYSVAENNMKADLCHRMQKLSDDVICISDDSDRECHTSLRKVKAAIEKMNTVSHLFATSKNNETAATSKACHQSDRIFINSRKKKGHKIDPQTQILLSKLKSEVKTETSIADYLRDLDQMSEGSSSESDFVEKISGSVSDTALLKPCVATKQSTVVQTSPEPTGAGRYGNCKQTAEKLRKLSIFGGNIVVQVFNEKSLLCDESKNITSSSALNQLSNNEEQSNDKSKLFKNLPSNLDTAECSDNLLDKEVALLNAEQSLLRSHDNNSSLVVAKKQSNTSRQAISLQLENIKCDHREQLPEVSSRVPTDDHKLGSPIETVLNVQKQAKESLNSTEKCQNAHTSIISEVVIEDSKKDLNRKLIHKPEPSLKHGPAKRCYRDQVGHSETETESDLADAFRPALSKRTNSDRARPSETETEATDSCSGVSRKSLSPYSRDAKRKRTDRSYESSPYSRKRRRSSSSSSSGSRNQSLSPRRRNSRSSSRLSKDSSIYHRRRHYRRDRRSRSPSRYRSRYSSPLYSRRRHSTSPTSYSRRSRSRSRSRYSSRKRDDRYRRSVSSSRSRDSSPSNGYRRYKSKSPRRYSRGDSHSPSARRSIGSRTSNWTKRDYYSKSRNDKFWTLMNESLQVTKSKNQHPFDMLYSITNMSTQKSASNSGNMLNSNIPKSSLPYTSGTVNASGMSAPRQGNGTATLANMNVPKQVTSTATLANVSVPKQVTSTATLANVSVPKQVTSTATLANVSVPKQVTSTATLANMSIPKQVTSTATLGNVCPPKQVTSTATLANVSVPKQVTSTATLANVSVPKEVTSTATVTDLSVPNQVTSTATVTDLSVPKQVSGGTADLTNASAPKQVSNTAALTKVVALKQVSALKNVSGTLTNVSATKQISGATVLTIVGAPRQVKGTAVLKNVSTPKQVSATATLTNVSAPKPLIGTATLTNVSAPEPLIGTATLTSVSALKQESGTATLTNLSAPKQVSGTATLTNMSAPKQATGTATLTNVIAPKQESGTATLTNKSAPKPLIGTAALNASASKLVGNAAALSNVVALKQVSGTVTLANVSSPKRVSGTATVANVCLPKQVNGPATSANLSVPKQKSGPATNLSVPTTSTNLSIPKQVSGPTTSTNLSVPKQTSGPALTKVCSAGSSINMSAQKCTVDTGIKTVVKIEASNVQTNDTRTSYCQKATDLVKSGAKVNEMSTAGGKASVVDAHKLESEGSREHPIAGSSKDYSEMLQSYQQAKSQHVSSQYLRNHNVTVKHLIIFQLGISITNDLKALLPYSPHTVLSDRHLSREVQQKRCMETIECCLKHLSVSTELISKCKIEPVINTFGNLPFEERLEHFCNEQVLLEVNVIKKCQYVLEEQQGQVHLLKSYIKYKLIGSDRDRSVFEPGTYCGEPLPEDLQVSVRGFTFIVPREVLHEDVALSIKDALEASYQTILELMKTTDFGREHFRVPEILLLEEEKFEMYSQGNCFLILNKSLPKKVFTRLLTIKNAIESIRQDTRKSNGEKYACEKQLIGERVSVLLSHIGNVTHKRVSKLRTLYNQLQDCEMYMRKVIGAEGLRNLPLFDRYMSAVKHHFEILNDEFKRPTYPSYE